MKTETVTPNENSVRCSDWVGVLRERAESDSSAGRAAGAGGVGENLPATDATDNDGAKQLDSTARASESE